MVVSRSLARNYTLVVHVVDVGLGESLQIQLQENSEKGTGECASRHLQFGQQITPRAKGGGKQCRVLETGGLVG